MTFSFEMADVQVACAICGPLYGRKHPTNDNGTLMKIEEFSMRQSQVGNIDVETHMVSWKSTGPIATPPKE